jgi:hypothetical protein
MRPLTGKPDAGKPPVRFGGRGEVLSLVPTPIKRKLPVAIGQMDQRSSRGSWRGGDLQNGRELGPGTGWVWSSGFSRSGVDRLVSRELLRRRVFHFQHLQRSTLSRLKPELQTGPRSGGRVQGSALVHGEPPPDSWLPNPGQHSPFRHSCRVVKACPWIRC